MADAPRGQRRWNFRKLLSRLLGGKWRAEEATSRNLRFEPLEGRALLATDLASITGVVSIGAPVNGANIELFSDVDNDALFEPGGDDGAALASDATDATGRYRFDGLIAGNYFVRQPAQTVGTQDLGQFVSGQINISALEAQGIAGTSIDDFNDAVPQSVVANSGTPTNSNASDHGAALGGERDMFVQLTVGGAGESVTFDSQAGRLLFDSTLSAQGEFTAVYDGNDNDATTIDFAGLAGEDLTDGGASTALQLRVQADQANATVRVRVFTDATSFSDASFTIPGTNVATDVVFDYVSDFALGAGAASTATFSNVNAIEVFIDTNTDGTDGRVTLLGAFGPTVETLDIDNEADLSLTKDINDPTPDVGQQVAFTIALANAGTAGATNVEVTDLLPAGLSFVSATASQGTYTSGTGVWDVGNVAVSATPTLTINATVTSSAAITNIAEITASDQPDPDSTPGNAAPAEDDRDTVQIDAPAAADLSLTKTVNNPTPALNGNVTFTITVNNGGPDQATAVVVEDLLPAGLTFVSATPSQGTYTQATGVWTVGTINSAGNATLSLVATVTVTTPVVNTAEVTASGLFDPDSTPDNQDVEEDDIDSVTVDAPSTADLSLNKTVNNATPNVGQNVTFTITVANGGPDGATGVVVEDLLPAGLTFVSATPSQGTYTQATGVWTVGAIAGNGNATLQLVATVASLGAKTNVAEITAAGQPDPDSTPDNNVLAEDDQDDETVTPQQIDLSLTKTVNDTTPNRNQDVTFTITLANGGPDQATGVVVEDLLPAGVTFVSSNPSQGNYVSGTGIWTVGTINSGANATLTITGTVTTIGAKTNTAEVTAADQADSDSTPDNNVAAEDDQDSETITPTVADISITKTVDDPTPDRNQNIVFTIVAANGGPDQATNVVVTDLLPAGLTFVSSTQSQGTYVSGTGVWTVGTINSGANATLTITATTATIGLKTNTAELTGLDQFDSDSTPNNQNPQEDDQDSQDVTPNVADLSITKSVSDSTPDRNQQITFTVVVSNAGPNDASGVTVGDLLPAGLTFVSSTQTQGSYVSATGVWTVGTVTNGGSATLTITATTATIGAKTNTAQVTASNQFDPDSTPNNSVAAEDDQDSEVVTPTVADLSVTKTVNNPTQSVGQNVIFTVTVSNAGPDTASNVSLTDLLPSGLTFVSSTPSQGTYNNSTGIWTVGSINSGANATLAITATVVGVGAKTNTAQVSASDQFDPDSTPGNSQASEDDQDSETVTPPQRFSKRLFLSRPSA